MADRIGRSRIQLTLRNEEEGSRDKGRRITAALPDGVYSGKATDRGLCGNSHCRNHGNRLLFESGLDPVSGFVAPGYSCIPMLDQMNDKPHAFKPMGSHSIRIHCYSAPPDTRRISENDPDDPYCWNSRRLLDARIRANLRNYVSGSFASDTFAEDQKRFLTVSQKQSQDLLAKRYLYKSSTQSAYEQVPWDSTLHPQKWKPISTLENPSSRSLFHVRPLKRLTVNNSCRRECQSLDMNLHPSATISDVHSS